jgi:hypothetical protein
MTSTAALNSAGAGKVAIDKLHQIWPDSLDYPYEVPAFSLLFTFHMPEIGVEYYTTELQRRRDGTLLQEVELPDFHSDPGKLHLTTLGAAMALARTESCSPRPSRRPVRS